jgi:hypothetical protein
MNEPKRSKGRPPKPPSDRKRNNLTFRARDNLKADLELAAEKAGRSVSEEIEYRLNRDFSWEETGRDIKRMLAEAAAEVSAAKVQAIRKAGFQIVREHGGERGGITVNVSAEMLLKEADGILRSGFVAADDVDKQPIEILVERAVAAALAKAGIGRPDE